MHRLLATLVAMAAFLGRASHFASAEDWPEFRGPTHQGHSAVKGLPIEWSEEKNVKWKIPFANEGWSSPSVVANRIYLTYAGTVDGGKENDRLLKAVCLDADDGKPIWDVEVFKQDHEKTEKIHGKNSHASPTAIVNGGRVYVHFGTQGTACLNAADGKILWKNQELSYRPQHGNGGSPALVDGVLIISCDGSDVNYVVGIDAANGKMKWKKERPDPNRGQRFSFSTPLAIEVDGKTQVVSPGTNVVIAYDPKTGDEIWSVKYTGYSVIPRPVYGHGLVFLSTGYNTPTLLAIRPDGKGDVTETHVAWQTNRGISHTPSFLLVEDELYTISDGGIATCFDAKSGEVVWTKRIGGNYSASPLYADGHIYLQDEKGEGIVLQAGKTFEEVARNKLPGRTLASYGVVGKGFLIRTDAALYRIEE